MDPEMEDSDVLFDEISGLMGVELAANPGKKRNISFVPFYTRNDQFTKTGSGQT